MAKYDIYIYLFIYLHFPTLLTWPYSHAEWVWHNKSWSVNARRFQKLGMPTIAILIEKLMMIIEFYGPMGVIFNIFSNNAIWWGYLPKIASWWFRIYFSHLHIYIYILTHIFICKAQWCLEWWSPVTHVFSVCIYIYVYIYIYSNYIAYVLGVYAETSKQVVTCALPRSRDFNSSVHPRVHLRLCISHLFQKKAICASVYACVFCCLCF